MLEKTVFGQAVTSVSEAPPTVKSQEANKAVQHGVEIAEAVTMSWSRTSLILVYVWSVNKNYLSTQYI
jgi:hypothetical protein